MKQIQKKDIAFLVELLCSARSQNDDLYDYASDERLKVTMQNCVTHELNIVKALRLLRNLEDAENPERSCFL